MKLQKISVWKVGKLFAFLVGAVFTALTATAATFSMVADIPYVNDSDASHVGNLYLPKKVTSSTPIVLTIHGGGWTSGDRASWRGVSEFFVKNLGFAAFNIEYRLAGTGKRWPACGDDCVAAAEYLLSNEFKSQYGFGYDKIWICGGSAGGHLALWTLVNLETNKVAGCIAISPIGDPSLDYAKNASRYSALFDGAVNLAAMDPCARITANMAPVLITHATGDQVVPIESSQSFANAYRTAGNQVTYFEYPDDLEPNEAGHCIWRPSSSPNRLIDSIERKIAYFAGVANTTGEWTARTMDVMAVNRASIGTVMSVDLRFGAGNGLTNRLYLAYGDTYGGDRIGGWERHSFIGEVTDEVTTLHVNMPAARNYKFFMDVPFPDNQIGVPVKDIVATGSQYVDTGIRLRGGDDLRCSFKPAIRANMGVMGTRTGLNEEHVQVTYASETFIFDYGSNPADSENYKKYRVVTETCATNVWYDLVLSADERSVSLDDKGKNTTHCPDEFYTTYSCCLFKVAGKPAIHDCAQGAVSAFSIERGGLYLASYIPYKFGDTYGFFDRVTGSFVTAVAGSGEFLGTEDASAETPLTSATETIGLGRTIVERSPRVIQSCIIVKDDDIKYLDVVFGVDNGFANVLYLAYDERDRGVDPNAWANLERIGTIPSYTNSWRVAVPQTARHCRIFLSMPVDGDSLPVALGSIVGNGSGYFDTGFTIKGGDSVQARAKATYRNGVVFGSRESSANVRNVLACFATGYISIDYNNSDYSLYRLTTAQDEGKYVNRWFDVLTSSEERSATDVANSTKEANSTVCPDQFETFTNCWLFYASGKMPSDIMSRFTGEIASFKMVRDGYLLTSLSPCRVGNEYGFYDCVNGNFLSAAEGTFSGVEDSDAAPLFSVSDDMAVNPRGIIIAVF